MALDISPDLLYGSKWISDDFVYDSSKVGIECSLQNTQKTSFDAQYHQSENSQLWLSIVSAIAIQLLVSILLFGLTSYAKADNEIYLAENQDNWLKLASLIDDEKLPTLYLNNQTHKNSWALALDNDIFAPGHRDRDYTYGVNFTYSGPGARDTEVSMKAPLSAIDDLLGLQKIIHARADNYSIEGGIFGLTPKDITQSLPIFNDRPYASLIYFSSSHERLDPASNLAWKTTLTIGALGLGLVGEMQNLVHEQISGKEARGWHNQISDGGELTARYAIARQHYLETISDSLEIKSTLQASVGYITEASWSLSLRHGKILSPWSSFNPELISYGEKSTYTSNEDPENEHYFWAGLTLKLRAYNAFLEGQFRDSTVSYDHHELNPFVLEGWAGYTYAFKQGYRFSYVLRGQTSEIQHGIGDRNILWGGLILTKTI